MGPWIGTGDGVTRATFGGRGDAASGKGEGDGANPLGVYRCIGAGVPGVGE